MDDASQNDRKSRIQRLQDRVEGGYYDSQDSRQLIAEFLLDCDAFWQKKSVKRRATSTDAGLGE